MSLEERIAELTEQIKVLTEVMKNGVPTKAEKSSSGTQSTAKEPPEPSSKQETPTAEKVMKETAKTKAEEKPTSKAMKFTDFAPEIFAGIAKLRANLPKNVWTPAVRGVFNEFQSKENQPLDEELLTPEQYAPMLARFQEVFNELMAGKE